MREMTMQWLRVDEADLDAIERDPDVAGTLMEDREPLDVGRAWHGVHALLNGSPWGGEGAAFDVVLGGTALGDPSTYEPVRALLPERVAAVAELLGGTSVDQLRGGFTHARFRQWEVYPDGAWDAPDALTAFVGPALSALTAFYAEAAAAGDGVLVRLA